MCVKHTCESMYGCGCHHMLYYCNQSRQYINVFLLACRTETINDLSEWVGWVQSSGSAEQCSLVTIQHCDLSLLHSLTLKLCEGERWISGQQCKKNVCMENRCGSGEEKYIIRLRYT